MGINMLTARKSHKPRFKSVNIDNVESGDNGISLSLPLNMGEMSHLKNLQ